MRKRYFSTSYVSVYVCYIIFIFYIYTYITYIIYVYHIIVYKKLRITLRTG